MRKTILLHQVYFYNNSADDFFADPIGTPCASWVCLLIFADIRTHNLPLIFLEHHSKQQSKAIAFSFPVLSFVIDCYEIHGKVKCV